MKSKRGEAREDDWILFSEWETRKKEKPLGSGPNDLIREIRL